jgi:Fe-S oxidoreductase/nitrate reductase gamma subunit
VGIDYARDYLPFLPHTATLVAMYACVAVVAGLFIWGGVRRYRRYRSGGTGLWPSVSGEAPAWGPRLRRAALDVVAQSKVRERRLPAALHLPIFYGTALLFIGTAIVVVYEDILRWFGEFTLRGAFYVTFEAVLDAAGLALVIGVCIALWRRLVAKPDYLGRRSATTLVLCGLLFMGLSGFGLEAYRIAAHPNEWAAAAFVGSSLARLLDGVASDGGSAVIVYRVLWWTHAAAAFSLIVGLAWTGFSHVLVVPATVAVHDPARPRTRLTTPFSLVEAMESEEDVDLVAGTASTVVIAAPEKLSADACVACGRCHAECPAQAAGRPLSPRDLIQDVRRSLGTDLGGATVDVPAADFEAAVWSCTNCYACEQACPARIRHVDYVLDFRRALVDDNRVDEQKMAVLQALDRNSNPYRLPSHERAAWLVDLPYAEQITFGVAEPEEPPEYLYWIGCGAAYDERSSQVARATMDLLRAAGVSFVTLGPAEPCCGEPAKRLGEEGRFQMLAMTAIEMIKETGAQRLVTHCPHGLNTFLHEYPALGFTIPAVHHTELLAELVAAGRLDVGPAAAAPVAYHEPCNLARAGRPTAAALAILDGRGVLPPRHGERTFCCGGGGGNSFYQVQHEETRISALRFAELADTGVERIAVACPYCLTMLRDAAAASQGEAPEVIDVAEALLERLRPAAPGDPVGT